MRAFLAGAVKRAGSSDGSLMLAGGGASCDALEVVAEDEPGVGSGLDAGVAILGRRGGGVEWNDGGPRLRVEKAGGRRLLVENAGGCEYGVVVIRHHLSLIHI